MPLPLQPQVAGIENPVIAIDLRREGMLGQMAQLAQVRFLLRVADASSGAVVHQYEVGNPGRARKFNRRTGVQFVVQTLALGMLGQRQDGHGYLRFAGWICVVDSDSQALRSKMGAHLAAAPFAVSARRR